MKRLLLLAVLVCLLVVPATAVNITIYAYGTSSATGGTSANAWDWNTATQWTVAAAAPWSNTMDYGSGTTHVINNLTIRGSDAGNLLAGPNTFGVSGSNDGSSWTTLTNVSGQSGWSSLQIRYFNFSNSNSYRYYKIDQDDGATLTADRCYTVTGSKTGYGSASYLKCVVEV